jgi:hypothetical protein
MTTKTLPTKYGTLESAQTVPLLYQKVGIDAVVVPGKRSPEYRVRIRVAPLDRC